jgi:acetyltransferase-like isoleucine patch superfamily enzyme
MLGANFHFSFPERFSPNVVTDFDRGSIVHFGKCVRIHSGSKLKTQHGAKLTIGDNVRINCNCFIISHNYIQIGEGTEFGPNVFLYDHDHDFRAGLKENKFKSEPVIIGKNCWIGANSVILRGTKLGDNCVVGAGSVIKGIFPENNLIVQKRITEINQIQYRES